MQQLRPLVRSRTIAHLALGIALMLVFTLVPAALSLQAHPAALQTSGTTFQNDYSMMGRVRIEPVAKHDVPVQFVIVMDVSGSMNLNFLGQGVDSNGNIVQCDKSGDPALDRYITNCEGGASSQYPDERQRRNAVTKHALIDHFAQRMRPIDAIGLVSFNSNSKIEYYQHNSTSPEAQLYSGGKQYWFYGDNPADRARLEEVILIAGAKGGNPYVTAGSTASARGLRLAADLLRDAEKYGTRAAPPTMPDTPYKRIVIFLTDGVANVFLDPINGYNQIAKGRYDDNCPEGETDYHSSIQCNMGVLGPPDYAQEIVLPVTAMVNQSQNVLQQELDADVFSIALGQVGERGLVDVASQPSYFSRVARAEEIDSVFSSIPRQVTTSCDVSGVVGGWIDTIPPANYPLDSAWADAAGNPLTNPPAVDLTADPKVVGYITIRPPLGQGTLGEEYRIPIEIESERYGREVMSFSLDQIGGLPPGIYDYTAFVIYKGEDGIARMYDTIYDPDQGTLASEGTISIPELDGADVRLDPIHLKLSEELCAAPTPTPEPGDDPTNTPVTDDPTPTPEPDDDTTPTPEPGDDTTPVADDPTPTPEPDDDPTTPVADDPASTPEPDDDPTTPVADDPASTPEPGDGPTMPVADDPASTPEPGDNPTTPVADDPASTPEPDADSATTITPTETSTSTSTPVVQPDDVFPAPAASRVFLPLMTK